MTVPTLSRFLSPRSIAVIGASQNSNSIAGKPIEFLRQHGFKGALYPVNPRYEDVQGIRCYPDLKAIPGPIDLAIVVVAASRVLSVLEQCVELGVEYASIISSGFAETGDEGQQLQQQVKALCDKTGIRVNGPNAQGFLNINGRVAASFSPALSMSSIRAGDLGFVSQSGAFGFSVFSLGQQEQIGFSHVVTTGNEVDLTWIDFVDHLLDEESTRSISAYLEGIRDGVRFPDLARKALEVDKPITLCKVGRTDVGSRAAASHTAAVTGAHAVFDAACRQFGIQRTRDISDIFDYARVFSSGFRSSGPRLGIVTTSGGAGVMAADEAVELGLHVNPLARPTREAIEALIPPFGSASNPVDVTAEVMRRPESFRNAIQLMFEDDNLDMLVIVLTMVTGEQALDRARDIVEVTSAADKPLVVSWSVCDELSGEALAHLRDNSIPLYPSPVRAVRALKALNDFSHAVRRNQQAGIRRHLPSVDVPKEILKRLGHARSLTEFEGKQLLATFGIRVPREVQVNAPAAAIAAADDIGYPVALKVVARGLQHKTQAGGVQLGLKNAGEVGEATADILKQVAEKAPEVHVDGLLVSEMVDGGTEMILGMIHDQELGTTLVLGAGGVFVELIQDVSYRLAPISRIDANEMIDELKCAGVLAGARGHPVGDREALVDVLCQLSDLAMDIGDQITELEINPLIVLPEGMGVCALDALVVTH